LEHSSIFESVLFVLLYKKQNKKKEINSLYTALTFFVSATAFALHRQDKVLAFDYVKEVQSRRLHPCRTVNSVVCQDRVLEGADIRRDEVQPLFCPCRDTAPHRVAEDTAKRTSSATRCGAVW
jgi:hypothetical protein